MYSVILVSVSGPPWHIHDGGKIVGDDAGNRGAVPELLFCGDRRSDPATFRVPWAFLAGAWWKSERALMARKRHSKQRSRHCHRRPDEIDRKRRENGQAPHKAEHVDPDGSAANASTRFAGLCLLGYTSQWEEWLSFRLAGND